jgi:anaerobic C4-dicarboxylate transporter DcuB
MAARRPKVPARLKDPEMYEYMYGSTATSLGKEISASAKRAVYIFLASIAVIVLFASCQRSLPSYEDGSRLKMNIVIQIVMLTAAALMVIVSKASPKKAVAVSVLINSQGAVVVAMLPLAYSLGIPGPVLLGVLPSVYGYFFIPNYPSDIATVNFDRSGTTVIGKYLLNHSFMMPGLVSVAVSTIVASIISGLIF